MPRKLSSYHLAQLKRLEPQLREAVRAMDKASAESLMKEIQLIFTNDRSHARVLQAKNWYYHCLLDCGETEDARLGLEAVLKRANEGTRLYVEASSLLAVCYLRLQMIDQAKAMLRTVIRSARSITSPKRRRQYYDRLFERIEEEVYLSQLIGRDEGSLDPHEIESKAAALIQEKSPDQLYELIGSTVSNSTPQTVESIRKYSRTLLSESEQKLLLNGGANLPRGELGKKVASALKRVSWRAFCDPNSELYKLWSTQMPKLFGRGYFAAAFSTILLNWKIAVPQLAIGVTAVPLRFGCEEYCRVFKPDGLMIGRNEKS